MASPRLFLQYPKVPKLDLDKIPDKDKHPDSPYPQKRKHMPPKAKQHTPIIEEPADFKDDSESPKHKLKI